MRIRVDAASDLHLEVTHHALTRVARQLEHSELVARPHHYRPTARQPIVEHRRVIDGKAAHLPVVEEHRLVVRLHLRIGAVAIVIELLLTADKPRNLPVPASWCLPVAADVAAHPLIVGATEERRVVDLETGGAAQIARLALNESAPTREQNLLGIPG